MLLRHLPRKVGLALSGTRCVSGVKAVYRPLGLSRHCSRAAANVAQIKRRSLKLVWPIRLLLLCRFSDAGRDGPSTRSGGRRLKSAKARNRGRWGTVCAAVAAPVKAREQPAFPP